MISNVSMEEKVIRTNCRACHGGCGVPVHVKDGVIDSRVVTALSVCGKLPIVDYEGDPQCVIVWGNNVVREIGTSRLLLWHKGAA